MVYLLALATIAGIGALIVPTIVQQVNDLVDAALRCVRDLTAGRGPLGFLETKYWRNWRKRVLKPAASDSNRCPLPYHRMLTPRPGR